MTTIEFILRLFAALTAGLLIGIERQWHRKSAGLRTNTLVAVGSALYVLLSINMAQFGGDVTRIISQVVTGIGFLGAGIIFKDGLNVKGLTTAATVWCASALGCTAAAGLFKEALIGTITVMAINLFLIPLDKWVANHSEFDNPEKTEK
jgi:putative Mg2+ transporter-C (MgtC) family protein